MKGLINIWHVNNQHTPRRTSTCTYSVSEHSEIKRLTGGGGSGDDDDDDDDDDNYDDGDCKLVKSSVSLRKLVP